MRIWQICIVRDVELNMQFDALSRNFEFPSINLTLEICAMHFSYAKQQAGMPFFKHG